MTVKRITFFLIGAGLFACSRHFYKDFADTRITPTSDIIADSVVENLVNPYRIVLEAEMKIILGEAKFDLNTDRPNSNLGAWMCDALVHFTDTIELDAPVISILNTGGMRANIQQGPISVGDVFKVMPFDNQVALLKIDSSQIKSILSYLKNSGGEPISGFRVLNGSIYEMKEMNLGYFYIVTSDFLANGGDKMGFLNAPISKKIYPILLRDLFMNQIKIEKEIGEKEIKRISW